MVQRRCVTYQVMEEIPLVRTKAYALLDGFLPDCFHLVPPFTCIRYELEVWDRPWNVRDPCGVTEDSGQLVEKNHRRLTDVIAISTRW